MRRLRQLGAKALWRTLLTHSPGGKRLFLTFDDGPHPLHTPRLLELLAGHGASATFFMIGRHVATDRALVRAVVEQRHALGNHTLSHPRMDRITAAARRMEIDGMDKLLAEFDGRRTHWFRPPYGHLSAAIVAQCILERRVIAYWARDSLDYRAPAADVVTGLLDKPPRDGDIVLFHDDGATAAEALEVLLPRWVAEGRRLEALPEAATR